MSAVIHSVNVNPLGGVPKPRVDYARLRKEGVEGDKQNDLRHHGVVRRAVCLFSLQKILDLQTEGHPIDVGTTGENLTIEGLDWNYLEEGMELSIGDAVIELTKTASIRKIGNNPKLRESISIAARETTEKRLDKERMIKETLDILEDMA